MVSRRYLRVKTFQALYAYFQSDDQNQKKFENELFLSLERMHDLYLILLTIGQEIIHQSKLKMEDAKKKRLPSEDDLNPNLKFVNNQVFSLLERNVSLKEQVKNKKLSWAADQELMVKFFNFMKNHNVYQEYMSTRETSFEEDQKFVVDFYKKILPEFDLIISELEDKSIFWGYDELDFILSMILKTVKRFNQKSNEFDSILPLYRDKEEDVKLVKDLFRKTIESDDENAEMIGEKTKNWDVERIAMVDVLLMKMALTELLHFKSVPVKVTLNEYIELSKWYSTPKSKVFVNGVLDKLVAELKSNGKLKKIGKGLIEG